MHFCSGFCFRRRFSAEIPRELLVYLLKNHGKVLTHRNLLSAVWGGNYTEQTEYLRVFLGNMRKKIEQNPSKPHYIVTEPWIGDRFNPSA